MQFLITIHRPSGYDFSQITAEVMRDIDAVNEEMVAAGVRVFVGGLQDPDLATTVLWSENGTTQTRTGAFLNSDHYVNGLWVIEASSREEANEWGRKAAQACRGSVEVRPFF